MEVWRLCDWGLEVLGLKSFGVSGCQNVGGIDLGSWDDHFKGS